MQLKVHNRTQFSKNTSRLRAEDIIPGIIYWKSLEKNIPVSFDKNEFLKVYKSAGTSSVVKTDGDYKWLVLIHDYQVDPVKDSLLHVDLLAVKSDEKVSAYVQVISEGTSLLEKNGEGKLEYVKDTVHVEAFPLDLPPNIKIDISKIETLSDGVFVKDLDFGDKITVLDDPELPLIVAVANISEVEEDTTTGEEWSEEWASWTTTESSEWTSGENESAE